MNSIVSIQTRIGRQAQSGTRGFARGASAIAVVLGLAWSNGPALADEGEEQQFPVTGLIIELTDNDIELQAFVDGSDWRRLEIFTPGEARIFNLRAQRSLRRQGGFSELFFASEPTHYLEDEPDFDGPIEDFLNRFPAGVYEFEGVTLGGVELEGDATLSHVLPALPEIVAPLSDGEDPPLLDPNQVVIEWEPVTTRFIGAGGVEILEYQVIVEEIEPGRSVAWIDGTTRRALINVPPSTTRLTVSPEFLAPGASYEFEVLAIEISGNATISTGEFDTSD